VSKIHQLTNLDLWRIISASVLLGGGLMPPSAFVWLFWQTSPLLSVHGIAVNQAGGILLILLLVKNNTVL